MNLTGTILSILFLYVSADIACSLTCFSSQVQFRCKSLMFEVSLDEFMLNCDTWTSFCEIFIFIFTWLLDSSNTQGMLIKKSVNFEHCFLQWISCRNTRQIPLFFFSCWFLSVHLTFCAQDAHDEFASQMEGPMDHKMKTGWSHWTRRHFSYCHRCLIFSKGLSSM